MTLVAGTRVGAYGIVGALGAGGMDEVYRARHTNLIAAEGRSRWIRNEQAPSLDLSERRRNMQPVVL